MAKLHPWVAGVQQALLPLRNEAYAQQMKDYLRGQFELYGIQAGPRREAVKHLFSRDQLPKDSEISHVVNNCWALPEREFQMVAVDLLMKRKNAFTPDLLPDIEYWILSKSWWDTIDMIAINVVGALAKNHPDETLAQIEAWRNEQNFWLRRTAILFQLKYTKATDLGLLSDVIKENLHDKEFFIQKAIGWSLREYSKTDANFVRSFIDDNQIEGLAKREGLKWLSKR